MQATSPRLRRGLVATTKKKRPQLSLWQKWVEVKRFRLDGSSRIAFAILSTDTGGYSGLNEPFAYTYRLRQIHLVILANTRARTLQEF